MSEFLRKQRRTALFSIGMALLIVPMVLVSWHEGNHYVNSVFLMGFLFGYIWERWQLYRAIEGVVRSVGESAEAGAAS